MSTALTICLIILVIVSIAAIVTVTVYLVKLMMDVCVLTRNLDETTSMVKTELGPILSELKKTMQSINTIAEKADNQVASVKKSVTAILGIISCFFGGFNKFSGSFLKGFGAAFNLFRKK